jgi:Pyruvate/2-oxoacid:ferredoxin oxidoreductase delta subunit
MAHAKIAPARKKKIKTLLWMMNKQNQRFIPPARPLVEMMDLVTTDQELEYLLRMGTASYGYSQALKAARMPEELFQPFFDTMQRKGLVQVGSGAQGERHFRLNAVAVGWYEAMMHYIVGRPEERAFSEKWNEFFKYFQRFNFFPLRNLQNRVLRRLANPSQNAALMDPAQKDKSRRRTIPINTAVSTAETRIIPTFEVSDLVESFGNQDAIYVFPCVCRRGNALIDSPCRFDMPEESCIGFGEEARTWAEWGYGRHVTKAEAIDILKTVRRQGAVHSVIHERDDCHLPALAICNCCWDCCGLLKGYNMGGLSLTYKSSYIARIKDSQQCKGCGNCAKYCPTAAMQVVDKRVVFNSDRCIGCGQCAFQCLQNNIEMYPDQRTVYLPILKQSEARITK